jgi:hypothetical protein
MSIFKNLFGGSERTDKKSGNDKPNIDKLVKSENINNSIIELDNYISALCDYGNSIEKLNEVQKHFFFNQNLEREINNGGFKQYYFNSSGDYANETIISLKEIGANKTAAIIEKANDQFPDTIVPKNRAIRQEVLVQIEKKASEIWEELDQNFFDYEDDLNSLNIEYIKKNKEYF